MTLKIIYKFTKVFPRNTNHVLKNTFVIITIILFCRYLISVFSVFRVSSIKIRLFSYMYTQIRTFKPTMISML